jgi:ribosomal protein L14E/L6E/L27E
MNDRIVVGQLVKSKTGRDQGRHFLILEIDEKKGYVKLVDGDRRGITNPKKKNISHIQVTNSVVQEFQERIAEGLSPRDQDIKRYLSELTVD